MAPSGRERPRRVTSASSSRGVLRDMDVRAMLRDARTRLVLTSGTLLFLELVLIRWIPAEVRYIGFFSNFVLMASFLGIGLGILLGRRLQLDSVSVFPFLLLAIVGLISKAQLNVQVHDPN